MGAEPSHPVGVSSVVPVEELQQMLAWAGAAPSARNAQPWRWRLLADGVELHLERSGASYRSDVIGCGAALHHLQVAAAALGWRPALRSGVRRAPDADAPLAVVGLSPTPAPDDGRALTALQDRCTDRRRFTTWPVPDTRLRGLAAIAHEWGALARPVLDTPTRFRLELLTRHGAPVSEAGHAVGEEQDGGLAGSDGVIVLGGDTDAPEAWLRTGQALSALWLAATRADLAVVPISGPIEADESRATLRDGILAGAMEPHLLVRVGWRQIGRRDLTRTPRRPWRELLLP